MGNYESDKKHCRVFTFKFVRNRDQDIIDALERAKNKQAYIKRLIRADLKKKRPDIDDYLDAAEDQ